tara:strand:- start:1667 stop:2869 length:1203 start_codon:yes stop_codon:yes gene_type:complete
MKLILMRYFKKINKASLLIVFLTSSFIYSQVSDNFPDPFSTESEYNFELKKRNRIGKISYSKSLNEKYSSRVIYTFSDKVKKKAIKSTYSENSPEDNVKSDYNIIESDIYLWYDYSFDAYSNYPDGQLREKGPFEHRYESYAQWDDGIAKAMDVFTLGFTKSKTGFLLKDGMWEGWYDSGELRYRSNHVNGKVHGKVDIFFKDGRKKIEAKYSYNKLYSAKAFYPNGKLRMQFSNGKEDEFYPNGYLKSESLNGKVIQSYKESEKAFLWTKEKDKNYQAAFLLAQNLFENAIDNDGDPVKRSEDNVRFIDKSSIDRDNKTYKKFIFKGNLNVKTFRKTVREYEDDPLVLRNLDAGIAQNYGFSYYYDRTKTFYVRGTGERTYTVGCNNGECSIINEKSQY